MQSLEDVIKKDWSENFKPVLFNSYLFKGENFNKEKFIAIVVAPNEDEAYKKLKKDMNIDAICGGCYVKFEENCIELNLFSDFDQPCVIQKIKI